MVCLVTGAAGFIGSSISKKLIEDCHEVYIIDRLRTNNKFSIPNKAILIEGDFSKDETIAKLNNRKFDVIFHIGGQSSGESSFEDPMYDLNTNTIATLKLLQYAVKTSCKKFIYASSMSVYGEKENKECFAEEDSTNPKSFYAVGKLASEKYLNIFSQQYNIECVALRYFNVYGPGQNLENLKQGMLSIYLKQCLDPSFNTILVKGSLNRFRDLVYIDDVVDITIESAVNDNFVNKVINIGTGEKTTVSTMLKLIKEYTNINKELEVIEGTPGDQFGIYSNNDKLLSLYDKKLTNLNDGLKKMIEYLKNNRRS